MSTTSVVDDQSLEVSDTEGRRESNPTGGEDVPGRGWGSWLTTSLMAIPGMIMALGRAGRQLRTLPLVLTSLVLDWFVPRSRFEGDELRLFISLSVCNIPLMISEPCMTSQLTSGTVQSDSPLCSGSARIAVRRFMTSSSLEISSKPFSRRTWADGFCHWSWAICRRACRSSLSRCLTSASSRRHWKRKMISTENKEGCVG